MTLHPDSSALYRQDPQTRHRTPVATSAAAVRCSSVTRSRLLALLIVSMATTLLLLVHCVRSCDLITRRHQTCCHGNADDYLAAGHDSVVNNSRADQVSREHQVSPEPVTPPTATLENAADRENSVARFGEVAPDMARGTSPFSREITVSRDYLDSQKLQRDHDSSLPEYQVSRKKSVSQERHISPAIKNQISRDHDEISRKNPVHTCIASEKHSQISGENKNDGLRENHAQITRENDNQTSRRNQNHVTRENHNKILREYENQVKRENQNHNPIAQEKQNKVTREKENKLSRESQASQKNEISRDKTRGQGRLRRRLPQCLIIGVRKGGTRALLEFLNLHPAILAGKQEMHFFDDDRKYALGLNWYRKRMRHSLPEQITVEKTPAYFVDERVPQRVHSMNESIRLLLTVRDPIDRAISDYLQIHSSRLKRNKFHPRFEDLAVDARTGQVNRSYKAIRRSIYHRHFERWLRYFRLEQFHFVSGENLVRDPVEELRKVERFLGIENRLDEGRFYYNKTRGFYCMLSADDGSERCLAPSKGRIHPNIDPQVIEKLRLFFRPHNQLFYQMVGVDFGWK